MKSPDHIRRGRAWALILTGAILYAPANLVPVMTMTIPGHHDKLTVWGGVVELYEVGLWPASVVVFLASICVPLFKLISIGLLLIMDGSPHYCLERTKVFRVIETIGTWSMVDIFLLSVLVAVGQMKLLASIEAQPGAIFFAGVLMCTIFATHNYDVRMIWRNSTR